MLAVLKLLLWVCLLEIKRILYRLSLLVVILRHLDTTILGTNGLNSADVPLSNKQTKNKTNKQTWTPHFLPPFHLSNIIEEQCLPYVVNCKFRITLFYYNGRGPRRRLMMCKNDTDMYIYYLHTYIHIYQKYPAYKTILPAQLTGLKLTTLHLKLTLTKDVVFIIRHLFYLTVFVICDLYFLVIYTARENLVVYPTLKWQFHRLTVVKSKSNLIN